MKFSFSLVNPEILSIHAAALILGGAAFLSRLLGLFRDRLLASRFGAGETLDIYYAAFQIPDILYTILLLGAASAAVLPVFLERERMDTEAAERFIGNLTTFFVVVGGILVLIAAVFAPWLVQFVAPGFSAEALAEVTSLTRIILPNAVLLGVAGIFASVLQARHRFVAFALPPIFYNLAIIAGVLFFAPRFGSSGLAAGVLLGGVAEILVLLPALSRIRFHVRPSFTLDDPGVRQVIRTALPRVLALSMTQFVLIALTAIASFFTAGSIAVFKFASNLLYVPVGLFGVSYALAVFPKLSRSGLAGAGAEFSTQLTAGIRAVLFWALPIATLMVVLRAHIVRVVLGAGVFDWEDTRLVAACLALFAPAVVTESVLPLVLRAFYALGETKRPLVWDLCGSVITVLAAFGCSWFFFARPGVLEFIANFLRIGDLASPRVIGIAIGFSIGSAVNLVMLVAVLMRSIRKRLSVQLELDLMAFTTMFGAAVLGSIAAYAALLPFPVLVPTNTLLGIFAQGAIAGAVGFFVYGLLLKGRQSREFAFLLENIRLRRYVPRRTPKVFEAEKVNGEVR